MPKEYEYRFVDIDANKIKKILKENGGKVYQKRYKMKIYNYKHPDYPTYDIRVRNEGRDKTLTIKIYNKTKFPDEYEIKIDNMNMANKMVKLLGCKLRSYVEKIREFWHIKGAKEIVFDELPGLPVFVEVDCHSKNALIKMCKLLKLKPKDDFAQKDKYKYHYGITSDRDKNEALTFKNATKVLGKYITKNKPMFMKILKEQQKV